MIKAFDDRYKLWCLSLLTDNPIYEFSANLELVVRMVNQVCDESLRRRPIKIIILIFDQTDLAFLRLIVEKIPNVQLELFPTIKFPHELRTFDLKRSTIQPYQYTLLHSDFAFGFNMMNFGDYDIAPRPFESHLSRCPECRRYIRPDMRLSEQLINTDVLESPLTVGSSWRNFELFAVTRHPIPVGGVGRIVDSLGPRIWLCFVLIVAIQYTLFFSGDSVIGRQRFFALSWAVTVGSFTFFYSTDLRDVLVSPQLEKPINNLLDIDFKQSVVFVHPTYLDLFNEEIVTTFHFYQPNPELYPEQFQWSDEGRFLEHSSTYLDKLAHDRNAVLICHRDMFDYLVYNFERTRGLSSTWLWRRSATSLTENGQMPTFLHDKYNPHIKRLYMFVLRIIEASLLSRSQSLAFRSKIDTTINPHTLHGSDYNGQRLGLNHMIQAFTVHILGLIVTIFGFSSEIAAPTAMKKIPFKRRSSEKVAVCLRCAFIAIVLVSISVIVIIATASGLMFKPDPLFAFGTAAILTPPYLIKHLGTHFMYKGASLVIAGQVRAFFYDESSQTYQSCFETVVPHMNNFTYSADESMAFLSVAAQFKNSGMVVICTQVSLQHCSVMDISTFGRRATLFKGFRLPIQTTASLVEDGRVWWLSGGFEVDYLTFDRFQFALTNKIAIFEDRKGVITKQKDLELPMANVKHCMLDLGDGRAFMFGGYRLLCHGPSYWQCLESQINKTDSREAFIYDNTSWKRVPGLSPCKHPRYSNYMATCTKRRNLDHYEVIIPSFDYLAQKRCTAILDLKSLKWSKLRKDVHRSSLYGGVAISVANDTRVLYLGGINANETTLRTVYELVDYEWVLKPEAELPLPMSIVPAPISYFPVHSEHCH